MKKHWFVFIYFLFASPFISFSQHRVAKDSIFIFKYENYEYELQIEAKSKLKIQIINNNFRENTSEPKIQVNVINGKKPFKVKGEINDKVKKTKRFTIQLYPEDEQKITIIDDRKRSTILNIKRKRLAPKETEESQNSINPSIEEASKAQSSSGNTLLIILGVIGLVLAVLLIYVFLLKKEQSINEKPENTPMKRPTPPDLSIKVIEDESPMYEINLQEYWEDSLVKNVKINENCAKEIQSFLNKRQVIPLQNQEKVPEVGGYLLGKVQPIANFYEIILQYFLPDEIAESDEFAISFHTDTQVALDDLREKTGTQLVGWLHTHPGHTPFLSQTDLRTHEGFFRKPFQVAVVIDTLTEKWDAGIFTRKNDNSLNNRQDKKKWLDWSKISTWQVEV